MAPHYEIASQEFSDRCRTPNGLDSLVANALRLLSRSVGNVLYCFFGDRHRDYDLTFEVSVRFALVFFSTRSMRICDFAQVATADSASLIFLQARQPQGFIVSPLWLSLIHI